MLAVCQVGRQYTACVWEKDLSQLFLSEPSATPANNDPKLRADDLVENGLSRPKDLELSSLFKSSAVLVRYAFSRLIQP